MSWSNIYTCLVFGSTFLIGILFSLIPLIKEVPIKRKILILIIFSIVHFGVVFLTTWIDSLISDMTSSLSFNWGDFFYIRYLFIYLIDILALFFLGGAKISTSLFIVNLGYCFQHACQYLYQIILTLLSFGMFTIEAFWIRLGFTIIFAICFFFLTRKRLLNIDENKIKMNLFLLFFVTAATFFLILANSYFWNFTKDASLTDSQRDFWRISILLFTASIAILLMMLQLNVLKTDELSDDLKITKKMLKEEKEHYEKEKVIIDALNIKSHDLKHQLMNSNVSLTKESIEEIGKIVSNYDSFFDTGNPAIDVILTEKELICKKKHIRFTSIVDGKKLSFISESDLYSLFGNILDNAIEAVDKLENDEEKVISISTESKNDFLIIHEENRFDGNIIFKNNELQTTKNDNIYHGFGTKSIKLIVTRYNGTLSFKNKGNSFILDIVLPIKE